MSQRKALISESDQTRIKAAVARAEGKTAGEVMPVIARRSSVYPAPEWRGAAVGAVLGAVLMALLWAPSRAWADGGIVEYLMPVAVSLISGISAYFLVNIIPPLERLLTTKLEINSAITDAVFREFMVNNLSETRDRSGVLIYISLFERRVQILADSGINQKVEPSAWKEFADAIAAGIREGKMSDALCASIDDMGDLLADYFPVKDDDTNELGDLVIRD